MLFSCMVMAQEKGTAVLYGYKQGVLPGVIRKHNISELPREQANERVAKPMKPKFNYMIYIVSSKRITPVEIWINGIAQNVQFRPVDSTPVVLTNYNLPMHPKTVQLVPKTKRAVIQLTPGTVLEGPQNEKLSGIAAENELVVVYKAGKKTCYVALRHFTPLEPVATM